MNKKCIVCKNIFEKPTTCSNREWREGRKTCSKKCKYILHAKMQSGSNNHNYKGGTIHSNGYRYIRVDNKRVLHHRYVMEQFLKRKLSRKEVVHHKNGIKTDNSIENLEVLSLKVHCSLHVPKGSYVGKNSLG